MTGERHPQPEFTVYWRPGCGFCHSLLSRLEASDVAFNRVNIWQDPEGAAYVRSVARGNETVPTVRIGDRALVNPTFDELTTALTDEPTDRSRDVAG